MQNKISIEFDKQWIIWNHKYDTVNMIKIFVHKIIRNIALYETNLCKYNHPFVISFCVIFLFNNLFKAW